MLKRYHEVVRPALQKEFGYTNPMQVPKLEKIVINMGVGEAAGDQKKLDAAVAELALISGQKPVKTLAKKAIAGFKIRKGLADRLQGHAAQGADVRIPRPARHHRAAAGARFPRHPADKGFDGRGNFALGLKEQIIFPEIVYDRVDPIRGMDIVFVTTAKTDAEAKALLKAVRSAVRAEVSDTEGPEDPVGLGETLNWKTAGACRQVPEGKTGWPRRLRSTATRSGSDWRSATRASAPRSSRS